MTSAREPAPLALEPAALLDLLGRARRALARGDEAELGRLQHPCFPGMAAPQGAVRRQSGERLVGVEATLFEQQLRAVAQAALMRLSWSAPRSRSRQISSARAPATSKTFARTPRLERQPQLAAAVAARAAGSLEQVAEAPADRRGIDVGFAVEDDAPAAALADRAGVSAGSRHIKATASRPQRRGRPRAARDARHPRAH